MDNKEMQENLMIIRTIAGKIEAWVRDIETRKVTKKSEVITMLQAIKDEAYIAGLTIDKMGIE